MSQNERTDAASRSAAQAPRRGSTQRKQKGVEHSQLTYGFPGCSWVEETQDVISCSPAKWSKIKDDPAYAGWSPIEFTLCVVVVGPMVRRQEPLTDEQTEEFLAYSKHRRESA
jgi:hypothetical protein